MNTIKRPVILTAAIIVSGLWLGGLALAWMHLTSRKTELRGQVERLEREHAQLLRAGRAETSIIALQAEKMRVDRWSAALGTRLEKFLEAEIDDTLTRPQAYFEIAAFVDKWRRRSNEKRVELKNAERFGFGSFAHGGPDEEIIGDVLRQMQAMDRLLAIIIAAGPDKLESVQRGRVGRVVTPADNSDDYFEPMAGLRTGKSTGLFFRLVFSGPTRTLREVVNSLSAFDSGMLVRDVVVDESGQSKDTGVIMDAAKSVVEIVPHGSSRFTLIVECRPWPGMEKAVQP